MLWNVSTRTPLAYAGPFGSETTAGVAENQVCERPVSLIDIYPTLIDLCGLPPRDGLDGRSLQCLLKNPGQTWDHPVVTTFGFNNHAIQPPVSDTSVMEIAEKSCMNTPVILTSGKIWPHSDNTKLQSLT